MPLTIGSPKMPLPPLAKLSPDFSASLNGERYKSEVDGVGSLLAVLCESNPTTKPKSILQKIHMCHSLLKENPA